jgi:hypothetical protein
MILPENKNKTRFEIERKKIDAVTRPVALCYVFAGVFIFFLKILFF